MLHHQGTLRRVLLRNLSSSAVSCALPVALKDMKLVLEKSIGRQDPSRALAAFDKLQQEQATQDVPLLQRLVLLVAKRGHPQETPRAAKILHQLLMEKSFQADDTTQLAVIYTLDACLRHRRLEDALVLFKTVREMDMLVDLPVIDTLLKLLVNAHRIDEAVGILKEVLAQHNVRPLEQTFQALLMALMHQKRYEDVVALLELGRVNEVEFSTETYDPLVDLSQEQHTSENVQRLGKFMEYVNNALRMDGYWEEDEDDEDESGQDDDFEDDYDDDFEDEFD